MIQSKSKKQAIAKLMVAQGEIEEVLSLSVPAARYDPVLLPQALRDELSALRDHLHKIILTLKGEQ